MSPPQKDSENASSLAEIFDMRELLDSENAYQAVQALVAKVQQLIPKFREALTTVTDILARVDIGELLPALTGMLQRLGTLYQRLDPYLEEARLLPTLVDWARRWPQLGVGIGNLAGTLSEAGMPLDWTGSASDAYRISVGRQQAALAHTRTVADGVGTDAFWLATSAVSFYTQIVGTLPILIGAVIRMNTLLLRLGQNPLEITRNAAIHLTELVRRQVDVLLSGVTAYAERLVMYDIKSAALQTRAMDHQGYPGGVWPAVDSPSATHDYFRPRP